MSAAVEKLGLSGGRPNVVYVCEGLCTVAAHMLGTGIFFYTQIRFGWSARENLTLAATQGIVAVISALMASRVVKRLGARTALMVVHGISAAVMLACGMLNHLGPGVVVPLMLVQTACMMVNWPILESLVSTGVAADRLGRRLCIYNLVWSGFGVLTIAAMGALLQYAIGSFFYVVMTLQLAIMLIVWQTRDLVPVVEDVAHHTEPEPELRKQRWTALWLSRLALPATFVVAYSFSAVLPNLPSLETLDPAIKTVVASVWLAARWSAFLIFGVTVFWHTRPRLLLLATAIMLVAFLVTTLEPGVLLGVERSAGVNIAIMVLGQIVLGLAMGLIYSASLYFGMALSNGSTEHGGYHEALISLGQVSGPGVGLIAHALYGGSLTAAIVAIAGILVVTTAASGAVALQRR